MKNDKRRKKLLVEKAQKKMLNHVLRDWTILLAVTWTLAMIWQVVTVGPFDNLSQAALATWLRYAPMFLCLLCVIPLLVRRTLRMSNRVAGPLMRISREMRAFTGGEETSLVKLRDGDFGHELAHDFNQMIATTSASPTRATRSDSPENAKERLAVWPTAAAGERP